MNSETCTIIIKVKDQSDHYHEEDWVKNIWPYMQPWFTRRHGVNEGKIELEAGAVSVEWKYETDYPEDCDELCD
jgi:hypothetical protein